MQRRIAEVLSVSPLQALRSASDTLSMIADLSLEPLLNKGGKHGVLGKALDNRLGYIIHHPIGVDQNERLFVVLHECLVLGTDFANRDLITLRAKELAAARLVQCVESVTLEDVHQNIACIADAAMIAPQIVDALSQRLRQAELRRAGYEQLNFFAHVMFDMEQRDIIILDSSFETCIIKQLCTAVKAWKSERLETELHGEGGLLQLCRARISIREGVCTELSARFTHELSDAIGAFKHSSGLPLLQRELNLCTRLGQRAKGMALVCFTKAQSDAVLGALSDCLAKCMGTTVASDIQKLEWQLCHLLGSRHM